MDPVTIAAIVSAAAGVIKAGQASESAARASPTNASTIFGPSMFSSDNSGWLVNFGDDATQSQSNAAKVGPSLTNTATPVSTAPGGQSIVNPPNMPSAVTVTPDGVAVRAGSAGFSIPWIYLAGGVGIIALIVLVVKKKHHA